MKKIKLMLPIIVLLVFIFGLNVNAETTGGGSVEFDYYTGSSSNWTMRDTVQYYLTELPDNVKFVVMKSEVATGQYPYVPWNMAFYVVDPSLSYPDTLTYYKVQNGETRSYTMSVQSSSYNGVTMYRYGSAFYGNVEGQYESDKKNSNIRSVGVPVYDISGYANSVVALFDIANGTATQIYDESQDESLIIKDLHDYDKAIYDGRSKAEGIKHVVTWSDTYYANYPTNNLDVEFKVQMTLQNKQTGEKIDTGQITLSADTCNTSLQSKILDLYDYAERYEDTSGNDMTMYAYMPHNPIKVWARYVYTNNNIKVLGTWQECDKDYTKVNEDYTTDLNFTGFKYIEDKTTTPYSHKVTWTNTNYDNECYLIVSADLNWYSSGRLTSVKYVPIVKLSDTVKANTKEWTKSIPDLVDDYLDSQNISHSVFSSKYASKLYFQVIKTVNGVKQGSSIQWIDLKNQTTGNNAGSDSGTAKIDDKGNIVEDKDSTYHMDDNGNVTQSPYDVIPDLSEDDSILAYLGNLWKGLKYGITSLGNIFTGTMSLLGSITSTIPQFYTLYFSFMPPPLFSLIVLAFSVAVLLRIIGR